MKGQANTCNQCKWSKKHTPDLKDLSQTIRLCHFNPPVPVMIPTRDGPMMQTYQPVVTDDNYCAKFEPKLQA